MYFEGWERGRGKGKKGREGGEKLGKERVVGYEGGFFCFFLLGRKQTDILLSLQLLISSYLSYLFFITISLVFLKMDDFKRDVFVFYAVVVVSCRTRAGFLFAIPPFSVHPHAHNLQGSLK